MFKYNFEEFIIHDLIKQFFAAVQIHSWVKISCSSSTTVNQNFFHNKVCSFFFFFKNVRKQEFRKLENNSF